MFPQAWQREANVVLSLGPAGAWDEFSTYNPRIVKYLDGSIYRDGEGRIYMSYNASRSGATADHDQSGMAVSAGSLNGVVWSRSATPFIGLGPVGSIDAGDAQVESVLYDNGVFHCWYDANSNTNPASSDQVSIAYAKGPTLFTLVKQGAAVLAAPGEDYYGAAVFLDPVTSRYGMLSTRHVGSLYQVVRLDSISLAGPWVERQGWAFTHPSGQCFVSSVRAIGNTVRMLYSTATINGVAEANGAGPFLTVGNNIAGPGPNYTPYGVDSVSDGGKEHLFFTAGPYTRGIGHEFSLDFSSTSTTSGVSDSVTAFRSLMAANKIIRFGPVAMSATLTTNIINPNVTSLSGPVGFTMTQPYVIIRHIRIVNKTSGSATFSLWLGATGANTAGTEVIGIATAVAANSAYDWYGALRMDVADFLVGGASAGTTLTFEAEGEVGLL